MREDGEEIKVLNLVAGGIHDCSHASKRIRVQGLETVEYSD
jgi:hypothetical protein